MTWIAYYEKGVLLISRFYGAIGVSDQKYSDSEQFSYANVRAAVDNLEKREISPLERHKEFVNATIKDNEPICAYCDRLEKMCMSALLDFLRKVLEQQAMANCFDIVGDVCSFNQIISQLLKTPKLWLSLTINLLIKVE